MPFFFYNFHELGNRNGNPENLRSKTEGMRFCPMHLLHGNSGRQEESTDLVSKDNTVDGVRIQEEHIQMHRLKWLCSYYLILIECNYKCIDIKYLEKFWILIIRLFFHQQVNAAVCSD